MKYLVSIIILLHICTVYGDEVLDWNRTSSEKYIFELQQIKGLSELVDRPTDIVVDGSHVHKEKVLIANRLIFNDGSKLIFSSQPEKKNSDTIYLIVNQIYLPPNVDSEITWEEPILKPP